MIIRLSGFLALGKSNGFSSQQMNLRVKRFDSSVKLQAFIPVTVTGVAAMTYHKLFNGCHDSPKDTFILFKVALGQRIFTAFPTPIGIDKEQLIYNVSGFYSNAIHVSSTLNTWFTFIQWQVLNQSVSPPLPCARQFQDDWSKLKLPCSANLEK